MDMLMDRSMLLFIPEHTGVDEKRFIHTHLTLCTVCPSARGSVNSLVVMRLVATSPRVY